MNGIFSISLDFELHWGGCEKWPLESYRTYFLNTRAVIPKILEMFDRYEIHATWATVGILFHRNKEEMLKNSPALKPTYINTELSVYNYIQTNGIGTNEEADPFHFAPSLISQIISTNNQELGTHTFSHFYCNEPGQTLEQFREDLKAAMRAATNYNRPLTSLVFPRNQFNDDYLKVCNEEGITIVRSNPDDWFWNIKSTQHESLWKRLNRGLDAYFPIGKKNIFELDSLKVRQGYPICLPASRLLRPYNAKELFLNDFKIRRIKNEMNNAAAQGKVYHLWWHPHNFGGNPDKNLRGLEEILKNFKHCQKNFGMKSLNMHELSALLISKNEKNKAA